MSTLVFVPGLLCTDVLFAPQINAFRDEINIVVADTFGMDSITAMAEALLSKTEGDLIVVGLSMGGYIAMEAARLAPDRLSALGLLSTAADEDSAKRRQLRHELIRISKIGKFKGVTPRLLPQFLSPQALLIAALKQQVTDMAGSVGQENFVLQQTAILNRSDQRAYLPDFNKPSLVLCGMLDQLTPPEKSTEMAALLGDCELVLLEQTGHLSTLEAPEQSIEAIRRLIQRTQ